MQEIITAEGLTIGYRQGRHEKAIHTGMEFRLEQGTLTCLLGPNGAGKSTLLRTLGGTQAPLKGGILLGGRPLAHYSEEEKSRLIGLVLTDKTFAGGLRVKELVALGRHPHIGFFGRLKKKDYAAVEQALEQTGITEKAESYVAELSDGERQKVMIAKALAQECPIILLDEPTAFLDVVSRIEIMNLLHNLATQGKTILLSTHDIEQALLLADKLWLISRGKGLVCGTTEDLVLRGDMDLFFKRGDIAFDPLSGSFRLSSADQPAITVEAEGELLFWTKNALMRNGYRIEEVGTIHPVADHPERIRLRVLSPEHIELFRGEDRQERHNSFQSLIQGLKEIRNG